MKMHFVLSLPLILSLGIVGCTSTPQKADQNTTVQTASRQTDNTADAKYIAKITAAPDSEHVSMAKRFLHSFNAGSLAMKSLTQELERQAVDQPGLAELTKRAMANIDADDFENIIARVYARHINQHHITELAHFAESDAGGRFMRISIDLAVNGKKANDDEIMRQFNADELLILMKFLQSESFAAFQKNIATINTEAQEEGGKLGMAIMQEYIRQQ